MSRTPSWLLMTPGGKAWCALPAKPDLDETGKQRSDEAGKRLWLPVMKWSTRELGDAVSAAVVEAIRKSYAGVLQAE